MNEEFNWTFNFKKDYRYCTDCYLHFSILFRHVIHVPKWPFNTENAF